VGSTSKSKGLLLTIYSLESLPEIDRENILASRLEEMQKYKDSQQLDAMYKMAGMGGDKDDEDEDEGPSRKKRRCSVSFVRLFADQFRKTHERDQGGVESYGRSQEAKKSKG